MKTIDAIKDLQLTLTPLYGEREARSIAAIVFEDGFPSRHDAKLEAVEFERFSDIKKRLLLGEPVQYILGKAHFYGLDFLVDPNVLIPRPETEELVHWMIKEIPRHFSQNTRLSILDIGTGSGCIPLTLKKYLPDADLAGLDISREALQIAKKNMERLKLKVDWRQINILDEKAWPMVGNYDVIVSNPPYIPVSEKKLMNANVLNYEPHLALFVENDDPMLFYRTISEFTQKHLKKKGLLFFEINEFQEVNVSNILTENGFKKMEIQEDMQGKPRMIKSMKT